MEECEVYITLSWADFCDHIKDINIPDVELNDDENEVN